MRELSLGFSPCPNDTFIFDAMVHGKIDTRGLKFRYVLEDVETLNRQAAEGRLDITKLSYSAFLHLTSGYALLHSGSALGKGVGPLLVARGQMDISGIDEWRIAIPGVQTTANLLFSLAFPRAKNKTEIIFHEVGGAVLDGRFDAGLLIHEGRFTYAQQGLTMLMDLGDWWEHTMHAAIPLGGIVARRTLPPETIADIDAVIRDSVAYAWSHYPRLPRFVTTHAQEMDESVMRQHIELYVNGFTTDLGDTGRRSVETLFTQAASAGLLKEGERPANLFY